MQNPLLFAFPPDVDEESLISGAEQLSRAVLSSDIEIIRANPDLNRQIVERRERLRFLIGFINENGALGKVSLLGVSVM
jgi:nuclear pore complex protein Nup133